MRISDWSSDVCSSDLRLDQLVLAQPWYRVATAEQHQDQHAEGVVVVLRPAVATPLGHRHRAVDRLVDRRLRHAGRQRETFAEHRRLAAGGSQVRSEERPVGEEVVDTCRSRGSRSPSKKKTKKTKQQ